MLTGVAVSLVLLAPQSDAASGPRDNGIFTGPAAAIEAATLPQGFQEEIVFSGLAQPAAVRFASDGRVFVAEKRGVIKVFDNLSDPTPTIFADLSTGVHDYWDRGLLGLALHPQFPSQPYLYVLYSLDAAIGGTPPRWNDACPTPPGPTADGCVIGARLSRLTANGNVMTGPEQVFIEDWCQQYPSHSIGSLAFGADGMLYVSGGDGASFNFADYGQDGAPLNPCGDPPGGVGATLAPPTAEGGALRSQDIRTSGGDPATLDGAILRLDPSTGAAATGNPNSTSTDLNVRRIVAHGLRNPFRITMRPETNEVWVGDVGWNDWEEIDRVVNPTSGPVNFGWPCYEGANSSGVSLRQSGYDAANLNICENLYAAGTGAVVSPYFTYNHAASVVTGDGCPTGGSSIAGLAFYPTQGGSYPASFANALFFADYSRKCIWVMTAGANGLPDPATRAAFVTAAAGPVDLQIGPGGDLFYAGYDDGTIRRIRFTGQPPPPPPPSGLVAAYSFNEGSGTSVADASGQGNAGTIASGTWTTQGRFGSALTFNGTSTRVSIADSNSLDLTNMTLEAWVYPIAGGGWRDVIYKGPDDNYYLESSSSTDAPATGGVFSPTLYGSSALPLNTWAHLAGTYDGQTLRLYVNGTQVASRPQTGPISATTGALTIGSDPTYGQYFSGRIDEVRVYNAALTQAQIQTDMGTPIGGSPDIDPPTAPSNLTATPISQTQINLAWTASSDTVGVTGYKVERCQGSTCSTFTEIATPTGTTYNNIGLTPGTTYRYRVRATDAVPNLSAYSNIATATTQGTPNTAPTAIISTPTNGTLWRVGDTISFSGSATDAQDGTVAAPGLSWTLVQQHCPSGEACHSHTVQNFNGVTSGSFVAPDHDYPSYLDLTLTATDSGGLSDTETVRLDPRTVVLTFQSSPTGLQVSVGSSSSTTTFTRTVIEGSTNSISAPSPQTLGGTTYDFVAWSDGGAATHNIVAGASATYTATYQAAVNADLRIVKTGSTGGSSATWVIAVTNLGPSPAQNVVVTDTLPSRLDFASASPGCTFTPSTRVVTCNAGSLANGANASLTITTTITGNGGGWITNTAQVTSSTADPASANNTSTDRVRAR
jgi:uncharacterized repeat protein (TIGR01451 family)